MEKLTVRAEKDRVARWRAAASADHRSLNNWIAKALDGAAVRATAFHQMLREQQEKGSVRVCGTCGEAGGHDPDCPDA